MGESRREIAEALGISVSSDACASRPVVPPETTRTLNDDDGRDDGYRVGPRAPQPIIGHIRASKADRDLVAVPRHSSGFLAESG